MFGKKKQTALSRIGKGAALGGGTSGLGGALVGSQFGRAALFAGTVSGIGTSATIALGVLGAVGGAVGGAVASSRVMEKKKKKFSLF